MEENMSINKLENLRRIREKRNITQVKLATDLEVTQELISRYELGSSFPQVNMLIKLANYFNCSVDYLLGLTECETPIKYLSTNYDANLVAKYHSLSSDNQKVFNKFLDFLINDTSKEQ